jgi:hypothetical protein
MYILTPELFIGFAAEHFLIGSILVSGAPRSCGAPPGVCQSRFGGLVEDLTDHRVVWIDIDLPPI